jgi:hypothetical protein
MLEPRVLDELDARLRALGAPICGAWAPGCSDAHIDALLQPLGIDLPEEARVWWRWHNGTRSDKPMTHREVFARIPLTIEQAAEAYEDERDAMHQLFGLTGLLAPLSEKPLIFFGGAGPALQPVPIYVQNDIDAPAVVLPSIGALVEAWIELLESGAWEPGDDGAWHKHPERVPSGLRLLGIS